MAPLRLKLLYMHRPIPPHSHSHTVGGFAAENWCQPVTTRSNRGFSVLPKDSLTHEQQCKNQTSDQRLTAPPLHQRQQCEYDLTFEVVPTKPSLVSPPTMLQHCFVEDLTHDGVCLINVVECC